MRSEDHKKESGLPDLSGLNFGADTRMKSDTDAPELFPEGFPKPVEPEMPGFPQEDPAGEVVEKEIFPPEPAKKDLPAEPEKASEGEAPKDAVPLGADAPAAEEPREDPRRKRIALICAAASLVVVILCLIVVGVVVFKNAMLNRISRPETLENSLSQEEIEYWATYNPDAETATIAAPTTVETKPQLEGDYITNILVIGQDYRKGEATKLADSIILCTLNRYNNTLTLTSFFRDTFIQMPNFKGHTCGRNRINVVYNLGWQWGGELGGMEMMDLCLQQNFGIEVDYNVEVNFETFSQVINQLGGVDVELSEAEVRYLKRDRTGFNNYVVPGMNHLDGYTALCYARARKLDGDVQRTGRQRQVVSAIIENVKSKSLKEIMDIAWDVLPLVLTDMTNDEIEDLIKDVVPMLKDLKINAGTCPAEGTFWGHMIDNLGGYPASVISFHLAPNREYMQWLCEVPYFEMSPDNPPEIPKLPIPKRKKTTVETTEETLLESTEPAETTKPTEGSTDKPVVPENPEAPDPEEVGPKPDGGAPKPDGDTKPEDGEPESPEGGGEPQIPEDGAGEPEVPQGGGNSDNGGGNSDNGGGVAPPPEPPVPPASPDPPAPVNPEPAPEDGVQE